MRFIESSQFYLSTDQDSNACEDFFPWRARINDNPTNYPIFQRTALKTNEPLNIPTNLPIKPTNPRNNPTNPVLASSAEKPHKHKKGRSRETPRSALNREKAQKYWSFWQKEKYPDSIKIRVLLWWRWGESNPRPKEYPREPLRAQRVV